MSEKPETTPTPPTPEKTTEPRQPSRGPVATAAAHLVTQLYERTRRPATDQETLAAVRKYAPVILSLAQLDDAPTIDPEA